MSATDILIRLAAVFVLIGLNGFFVAVEFALVSTRRARIDQMAVRGNGPAQLVQRMLEDPDRILAASQLGITMASLALGWVGESTIAAIIEPFIVHLPFSEVIAHSIGLVISFSLITALHIIVGEQAPKTFAIRYPEQTSMATARPTLLFDRVFRPFIWVLDAGTTAFLRLLGVKPVGHHGAVYTLAELQVLLAESREAGVVEHGEQQIISRAIEFGDRQVREVMIPRTDVRAVPIESTIQDALAVFQDHSHARFPVYGEDLDDIVGVITVKDILRYLAAHRDGYDHPIRALLRPAFYVHETKALNDLMVEMRERHAQMAIVFDEHGGTAGVVTAEELTEELVGRMSDELAAEDSNVQHIGEGRAVIDAQMRIDEANDQLNLALPEGEEYETVAGLILEVLQHVPTAGEVVGVAGVELAVVEMRGPKIEKVEIRRGTGA